MSRSKTPTLPWAILMYQQLRESLQANLGNRSLPLRMHHAVTNALLKLDQYYNMAKTNHFNVLATSKFNSIDDDSYTRTKEIFEYYFQEYEANAPALSGSKPVPSPQPAGANSLLANIARRSSSSLISTTAPKPASKFEWYAVFEHGKMEKEALENPLLWWKVCYLVILWFSLLIMVYRLISTSFPSSHAWPVTSWLSPELWPLSNVSFRNLVIFARTSVRV